MTNPQKQSQPDSYAEFLARKSVVAIPTGFNPAGFQPRRPLFEFQKDIVNWAIRRGRAAIFADCGLGKTAMQLTWAKEVSDHAGPVIILAPLAVADQTAAEGATLGIEVKHVREQSESDGHPIVVTNYDKLHRFDLSKFDGVVLDESSILKSFEGSTRKALTEGFKSTPYRLACTATPSPNDYMELGTHAEFLGVMTREEMLAMFFTHDGGETSKWRLKGHAQSDFWEWLCSWAVNIRKPSDLGYSDDGFTLPPLRTFEHVVQSSQKMDGYLFALPASSLDERRKARAASLGDRVARAAEISNKAGSEQWIAWCNLNSESEQLTQSIDGAVEVCGSMTEEEKESAIQGFIAGKHRVLVTKPTIAGFGLNFQFCARELFVGLSDSYEQFYQAVRRCWRFGQKREVDAHIVISDLEGAVLANIRRKERDAANMADQMVRYMSDISSEIIHGGVHTVTHYTPNKIIQFPKWL